jgi:hypothetical protein
MNRIVRVKIIRQPHGTVSGVSLSSYRSGEVYDIPPTLAEYLVMEEFALIEMRDRDRQHAPVAVERRRQA